MLEEPPTANPTKGPNKSIKDPNKYYARAPLPVLLTRPLVRQIPPVTIKDALGREVTTPSGQELVDRADVAVTEAADWALTPHRMVGETIIGAGTSAAASLADALRYAQGLQVEVGSSESEDENEDDAAAKSTRERAAPAS